MVWGAVISAVISAASVAVQAGMTAKAQKDAEKLMKKSSPGEKSMLALQEMKATDLAGMGGLSAGQYQRALMAEDAQAMQAQGLVNKLEENPFADAFKKEALARMMISQITQSAQRMQTNLVDLDTEMAAKNAIASSEIARGAASQEAMIVERENQLKLMEIQQKQQMWSNFSKLAASSAGAIAGIVKENQLATAKTPSATTTTTTVPQVDYSAEAVAFRNEKLPDSMTQTTMGITPNAVGNTNFDYVHATQAGLIPNEFNGFKEHYPIDGFDY